ncbi:Ferredoxin [Ascosphaera apis ARSEF 7405]|uniref:Ferredoxin n=1 Tax=Ascosphaera apis ARSEF 7405 TaxID=392613 RepID=A0A162IJB7_9EURO|nr:Ferredoxin [Ascosphaera apis ARSEF 7405]
MLLSKSAASPLRMLYRQSTIAYSVKPLSIQRARLSSISLAASRSPIASGRLVTPVVPVLTNRRLFSVTASQKHGHITPPKPGEELHVSFIDKDGQKFTFEVAEGDNLLDIAQANDIEMEVTDQDMYDKIPEPEDDENDMLDLAFGLTETSRLGCQVKMTKELDGLVVKLPSMTRNMQASDFSK